MSNPSKTKGTGGGKPLQPCRRCGGPKERGVRGGKYCAACRLIMVDVTAQMQNERGRRRAAEERAAKLASDKGLRRRRSDVTEGHKWCAHCQSERPLSSFAHHVDKVASYCIPCQRAYNRRRRVENVFGLTWDEYELLLACQDFRCAICGGLPRKYALSIDHNHKTGEIRGLLCGRCNHKLLGAANDDAARLRKAADYLEAGGAREVFGEPKYVPGSRLQSADDGAA